ncbi:dTDP-4-dehydrorhamnose reductase [Enterococcus sp. LJL98]
MNLIIGANGQLGTELCRLFDEQSISYIGTTTNELDITNQEQVTSFIRHLNPKVIYHCAAYTAVDNAEDEGKELNTLVNVEGTRNIALVAQELHAKLVYISTDYVFDGELRTGEYQTDSPTNPQNEYGRSKLEGEEVIKEIMSSYYIIRTSWVFGEFGHNFVYTMQKLAETRDSLTIVSDQVGRPTWTRTLAEFMQFVVEKPAAYGVYHLSNQGSCSWYEFAKEILKENIDITVSPVTSEEFPQKAKRPQYSIMDLSQSEALGFKIPRWEEALNQFLKRK